MPYYAVAKGKTQGIYMNWNDCEQQVKGYSGNSYKKFDSVTAADQFISSQGGSAASSSKTSSSANTNQGSSSGNAR